MGRHIPPQNLGPVKPTATPPMPPPKQVELMIGSNLSQSDLKRLLNATLEMSECVLNITKALRELAKDNPAVIKILDGKDNNK